MFKSTAAIRAGAKPGFTLDVEESRQHGAAQYAGPRAYSEDESLGVFLKHDASQEIVWVLDAPTTDYSTDTFLSFLLAVAEMGAQFAEVGAK